MPYLPGAGIPLSDGPVDGTLLSFTKTKSFANGLIELRSGIKYGPKLKSLGLNNFYLLLVSFPYYPYSFPDSLFPSLRHT